MLPRANRIAKGVLALLILYGLLSSQVEAFTSAHSDDCAKHCCGACHLGHSPLLASAHVVRVPLPAPSTWSIGADTVPSVPECAIPVRHARGPPA